MVIVWIRSRREHICASRNSKGLSGVALSRLRNPFFRYRTITYPTPKRQLNIMFIARIPGTTQST